MIEARLGLPEEILQLTDKPSVRDRLRGALRRTPDGRDTEARTHDGSPTSGRRWALVNGGHLAVLWAFAVLQPTLSFLSGNMEFFTPRQLHGWWFVLLFVGFALAPPAILLALEALGGLASVRLRQALHLLFSGVLIAFFALYALKRADPQGGWSLVAGSVAIAVAATVLYARVRPVRSVLTALTPAPAIFLLYFLLLTPAKGFALPPDGSPAELPPSTTPVVMVVFDELPTSSLMSENGEIARARYPNFAELARGSTWYRNAITNADHTTMAIPTMLTGRRPDPDLPPTLSGHPDNLFTLLGGNHDVHALEHLTWLCPNDLCPNDQSAPRRSLALASAVSRAAAGVVTPNDLLDAAGIKLRRRPMTWSEALADEDPRQERDPDELSRVQLERHPDAHFERFLELVQPSSPDGGRPPLYFLHLSLPHTPWRFLPSGKVYDAGGGSGGRRWPDAPDLVAHALQRHLLQTQFADRVLGRLVRRLREAGLYERSLLVVVADHGISFRPGGERRAINESNAADVGMVPLFIKAPGQEEGRTVDRPAPLLDLLPTIGDHLGIQMPWSTDGSSLRDGAEVGDATALITNREGEEIEVSFSTLERQRRATVKRQAALFGESGGSWDLFGIGAHSHLLGARVSALPQAPAGGATARLGSMRSYLASVDLDSPFVPAHFEGEIRGAPEVPADVAVAVNGRVAGVGRTLGGGEAARFSVMVPGSVFRPGRNRARVFGISSSRGDPALEPLSPGR